MSKRYPLYKNPAAWVGVLGFGFLIFEFFYHFPLVASGLFGTLAIWLTVNNLRVRSRFKKLGYRIGWRGRDTFYYMEQAGPMTRRLEFYCELGSKDPRSLYLPSADTWPKKMPEWAANRREEICDRIRSELRYRRIQFVEVESHAA